jgi:dissimilatory sulfite reductase (desulfoviridin) alpha/beta subunit
VEDDQIKMDPTKCNYCGRCVKSCPTDAWVGHPGYIVSFGGLFGNAISKGESFLPLIESEETLFRVLDAAITFFDQNANSGERFKFTLDRYGWEKFRAEMLEVVNNG